MGSARNGGVRLPHRLAVAALAAVTALGTLAAQVEAAATSGASTVSAPGKATTVTAAAHAGSAMVTWKAAPTNGTPITGYTVTSTPTSKTCTTTKTVLSCTVDGLGNGDTYTFRVRAANGQGAGPTSTPSKPVVPVTVPGAPTGIQAKGGNASATVSWSAPPANGTPITHYTVTGEPTLKTCTATTTLQCTVTGLTNGTQYTFTVKATNGYGTGPPSTPSPAVIPASPPTTPPTITAVAAGNESITLTWTPVAESHDGGAPITGYVVRAEVGVTVKVTTSLGATATTATVGSLVNGTSYRVTVAAVNDAGTGPPATSGALVPATEPGKVANVTAEPADGSALVLWTAAAANGTKVTTYTVTASPGSAQCTTSGALTCYVPTLSNGTTYAFTVTATNGRGSGTPSTASNTVVPAAVPSAPGTVKVAGKYGAVQVTWAAATGNGSPVTGYTATATPSGATCNTTGALTCTVPGLSNGTSYTFRVRATNSVGLGPSSAASTSVTPSTVPGPPTGVTASVGNGVVRVSWTAPATNGSPITGYTVTSSPTAKTCTASAGGRSCNFGSLVDGRPYTFTVVATNGDGPGTPSTPSNQVVPASTPTAGPTGANLTSTATTITASWTRLATTDDGGSPVTGYQVHASGRTLTNASITRQLTVSTHGTSRLSVPITGLPYGVPISVTVAARNAEGTGPATNAGSITLASVPAAPVGVNATTADGSAEVTWYDPEETLGGPTAVLVNDADHGTPITGYTVTSAPTGRTCTTTSFASNACYVTGLKNGTAYTFTVTATNGKGEGPASSPSTTPVVPAPVPSAPTSITAAPHDMSAGVTWSPSAETNGSPVTSYVVTSATAPKTKACTTSALTGTLHCTVSNLTNGRPDAFRVRAVNATGQGPRSVSSNVVIPATVPGAPGSVTAQAGDNQVTVSWKKPGTDGGSAISLYTVTSTPTGHTCTSSSTGTSPSCTVTDLANGTTYTFRVNAANAIGSGPTSGPVSAVPFSRPTGAPHITGQSSGDGSVTVTWSPLPAGTDGGQAVTKYQVRIDHDTTLDKTVTVAATTTTATVTGLINGTTYVAKVAAENSDGAGPTSPTPPLTPSTVPGPPRNPVANAGNGSAVVIWTPAVDNGTAVTGYAVTSTTGSHGCTAARGTAVTCTVTGLANGTAYTFAVVAHNGRGTGPTSTLTKAITPSTYPGPPQSPVVATAHVSSVTVTWQAPTTDGGSGITGYTVTSLPSAKTCTTSGALSCTVTGLADGTAYTFRVRAANVTGLGPSSEASNPATPSHLPTAPVSVSASLAGTGGTVRVSWKAATPNGTPIVSYTVTSTPVKGTCSTTKLTGSLSCTVTGLTDGTAYEFRVVATNGQGGGPASTLSNPVTPYAPPLVGPVITASSSTNQSVSIAWQPVPASTDGGYPISGYVVEAEVDSSEKAHDTLTPTATTATLTGLVNGTTYEVTVAAKNTEGTGPASTAPEPLVPSTVPGPAAGVRAVAGNEEAQVIWGAAPDGGAAVTGYVVTSSPTTRTCTTTGTLTCTVTGLQDGRAYTFRVVAHNLRGTGPTSTPSKPVTPETLPPAPVGVTATAGNGSAVVTWPATVTTGEPVLGYRVVSTKTPGLTCTTTGALTCPVPGLTNGFTYTFRVQARDASGYGPLSDPSNPVTPWLPPGPPLRVKATAGAGSAKVTWTPPAVVTTPIVGYVVTAEPGNQKCTTGGARFCTVSGLTDGTSYTFTVQAETTYGAGPPSAPSNAVIPEPSTTTPPRTSTPSKPTTPSKSASGASQGYWEVASDGGLFAFGDAGFYGSMGGKPLNEPIVGMTATPTGRGYWEVASDGGLFAFGNAGFYGSMGGKPLNEPIVGMTATPTGRGYWEVASDGGLFAFGNAGFYGSMGGKPLNEPIVGMTATPTGRGYWEVASDGGLFAFGTAGFEGSMGGKPLVKPIVGMSQVP